MEDRETSEAPIRGVSWKRDGRRRIRRVTGADRAVLEARAGGTAHSRRLLPADETPDSADLWGEFPRGRLVECDGRIAAAVAFVAGTARLSPGRHAWSPAETTGGRLLEPETEPGAPDLFVAALTYEPVEQRPGQPPAWLVDGPIQRVCQRIGAARTIACLRPARPPAERGISMAAFLQQLYFGAFQDALLSPLMAADFEPRGFLAADHTAFEHSRVLMVWDNSRQP